MRARLRCTGVAATWCPVHGDCTCPETVPESGYGRDMTSPGCPLHAPTSDHAS